MERPDTVTPAQLRAARALLDWSMLELARVAQVSISTIKRMEDERLRPDRARSVAAMQGALETAGVRFLWDDGDGPGVRLKLL